MYDSSHSATTVNSHGGDALVDASGTINPAALNSDASHASNVNGMLFLLNLSHIGAFYCSGSNPRFIPILQFYRLHR